MTTTQELRPRRYDIDALRVLAFSILILYHIAMLYVADWGFHIKSTYQYDWIKFPMLLINQWRMPLLFLVSGIASSFLIDKFNTISFLKSRSLRLLIPFVTGVILIVPPQAYLQACGNGSIVNSFGEMSYLDFLVHYFSFQQWPVDAFDGSEYGFTWNHLWFIPYLFVYTLLLVPLAMIIRISKLKTTFQRMGPVALILIPVLIQIIFQLTLNDEIPISHALINDWYAHAMYCTFFILGYLISDTDAVWQRIIDLRWISLLGAILCYCALLALWFKFNHHEWQDRLEGVIATLNQWLWLLTVLAWSAKFLNHPNNWLSYANNRIYPWYILHQTITIIAAYVLADFFLGGPIEFFLVLAATVLTCWAMTEFIIGRQKHLKFILGMK